MTTMTPDSTAEQLHHQMVEAIVRFGSARSEPVIAALRAVQRHAFLPNASLEEAYDHRVAVITKKDESGRHLSCASVATLVAGMLEHLRVGPGHHVFEVGAGTGYNAALLSELVGPDGAVTTADIDEEVTDGAARALEAVGYSRVHVLTRDGALGAAEDAPFDRIIVTVGAWDIPAAWFTQLRPGGRMVLPLRWRGQTRGVAFVLGDDGVLRSDAVFLCGFVPMIGQDGERTATLNAEPAVRIHYDIDQNLDPEALVGVLQTPQTSSWSGVTIGGNDPIDGIWLRATATDPAVCRIETTKEAIEAGVATPIIANLSPALVEGSSIAYLAFRRIEGAEPSRFELGANAHGSDGTALAERMCGHIRTWDVDRTAKPSLTARLLNDASTTVSGEIVKEHCAITVTYANLG